MIMGDMNAVIDRRVDKSKMGSTHSLIPYCFYNWLETNGLRDYWHIRNLNVRDYTFFSSPHNSFSRINYVFVKHQSMVQIVKTGIGL